MVGNAGMRTIVEVRDVSKCYGGKMGRHGHTENMTRALDHVNFTVEQGEAVGIVGPSGAGKSTLVRCLNYLEKPTTGTVVVEDQDLSTLTEAELRKVRTGIAMIFQHFNLLMQKNVLENVCFLLYIQGKKKAEARAKALELLEIVGLADRAKAYPAQLSGGQKQRVAIAEPWPPIHRYCSVTKPQALWIPRPHPPYLNFCRTSIRNSESPL